METQTSQAATSTLARDNDFDGGILLTSAQEVRQLEARASELQRQEDQALTEAMERPRKQQKRLELQVTLVSGSSSSSACLHVPVPPNEEVKLNMQLSLAVVSPDPPEPDAEDQEESTLMQRGPPVNRPLLESLTRPMSTRVNKLIRQRLLARIQLLLRECHILMREQNDLLQIFADDAQTTQASLSENQEGVADSIADLYVHMLQTQITTLLQVPMDVDPYDLVVQLAQGLDPEESGRRHRLVRERGAPRTTMRGTEEEVKKVANDILNETQALIYECDHHGRADMIRDYVATLVGGLQCTAAKAMVMVLLLAHHLPQPWPQCNTTSQARSRGRNFAVGVMASLNETFMANPVQDLHERPFGVQETVPLLPALSPLTMEIITFLEDAEYLLDNTSVDDVNNDEIEEIQDSLDRDVIQAMAESRIVQDTDKPATTSTTQYGGSTGSSVCPPPTGVTTSTFNASMDPAIMRTSQTGSTTSTLETLTTTPGSGSRSLTPRTRSRMMTAEHPTTTTSSPGTELRAQGTESSTAATTTSSSGTGLRTPGTGTGLRTPGTGSRTPTTLPSTSGTDETSPPLEPAKNVNEPKDTAQEKSKAFPSPKKKRKPPVPDKEGIKRFMKDGGSEREA